MALTEKQVRNGVPPAPGGEGGNVARPGPSSDVSGPKGAAEVYGNAWQESGRAPWTGQTAGTPGYAVEDWDAGAAVTEQAGER